MPGSVSVARDLVAAVAVGGGASEGRLESVRLAVSEALTNAVEHAQQQSGAEVHVRATVADGQLVVGVADERYDTHRMGFGLTVIAACSDHFMVGTSPAGGLEVEMRFNLDRAEPRRMAALAPAI